MSLDDFVARLPPDVGVDLLLPAGAASQVEDEAVLWGQGHSSASASQFGSRFLCGSLIIHLSPLVRSTDIRSLRM